MFLLKYFLLYKVNHVESVSQDANAVSGIDTIPCVDNVSCKVHVPNDMFEKAVVWFMTNTCPTLFATLPFFIFLPLSTQDILLPCSSAISSSRRRPTSFISTMCSRDSQLLTSILVRWVWEERAAWPRAWCDLGGPVNVISISYLSLSFPCPQGCSFFIPWYVS